MVDIADFKRFVRDLDDLDTFNNVEVRQLPYCVINKQTTEDSKPVKIRRKRFNPLIELGEYEFKQKYRFSKENILKLVEIIRDDLELERPPDVPSGASNQVPVDMQILIAIRQWGSNELPEIIADIHGITTHTLEKICRRVALALSSKASRYIRMPATLAEKEEVTRNFYAIAAFPQVIGAVKCQSVRLQKIIKSDRTSFEHTSAAHCECLVYIQIISDSSFKIRDFDCRLRPLSSKAYSNDQQIFQETRIKERFEQHEFRGRILLGGTNYICTNYLFTPIPVSQLSTKKETLFNTAHAYTQAAVKKTQHLWRQRFRIIDSDVLPCTSFRGAKHLLVALAVLHNIAIDLNDSCVDFVNHCDDHEFILDGAFKYELNRENELGNSGALSRSAFINKCF